MYVCRTKDGYSLVDENEHGAWWTINMDFAPVYCCFKLGRKLGRGLLEAD